MSSYRCVCPLCKTVVVSSEPRGTWADASLAIRAMYTHLTHRCERAPKSKGARQMLADNSIEAIEGAA